MMVIRYVVVVVYVPHLMYTLAVERKTSFLALFFHFCHFFVKSPSRTCGMFEQK